MDLLKRIIGAKTNDVETSDAVVVEPRHLTGEEFDRIVAGSNIPVLVDFWAEWCGPCRAIAPSVSKLAEEYAGRALITKLDADEYPDILQRYGIMGIPTLIFFKDGREQDRQVGFTSYGALKSKLDPLLA